MVNDNVLISTICDPTVDVQTVKSTLSFDYPLLSNTQYSLLLMHFNSFPQQSVSGTSISGSPSCLPTVPVPLLRSPNVKLSEGFPHSVSQSECSSCVSPMPPIIRKHSRKWVYHLFSFAIFRWYSSCWFNQNFRFWKLFSIWLSAIVRLCIFYPVELFVN